MILVTVVAERDNLQNLPTCFELRKIRAVTSVPEVSVSTGVDSLERLLKKGWLLSRRLNVTMPSSAPPLASRTAGKERQPRDVDPKAEITRVTRETCLGKRLQKSESPSSACNLGSDDARDVIQALEKKRKQLDDQIAKYIAERDEEYRRFKSELRRREKHARRREQSCVEPNTDVNKTRGNDGTEFQDQATVEQQSETPSAVESQGDAASLTSSTRSSLVGTPAHDSERELGGLFTPSFLPLLDSRHVRSRELRRRSSAPDLPAKPRASESEEIVPRHPDVTPQQAEIVHETGASPPPSAVLRRPRPSFTHQDSCSSVDNQQHPSLLKARRKSSSRKKVSFSIDNQILEPQDSVEAQTAARSEVTSSSTPSPAPSSLSSQSPPEKLLTAVQPRHPPISTTEHSRDESESQPQSQGEHVLHSGQTDLRDISSEAQVEQSLPQAEMSPPRDLAYDKSEDQSSIFDDDELLFGLDGDPPAKQPAKQPSAQATNLSSPAGPPPSPPVSRPNDRRQHASSPGRNAAAPSSSAGAPPQPAQFPTSLISSSLPIPIPPSRHRRASDARSEGFPLETPSRRPVNARDPDFDAVVKSDPDFSSFVGGVRGGSGVDPSDRNSYGYPASWGASYMERNSRRLPAQSNVAGANTGRRRMPGIREEMERGAVEGKSSGDGKKDEEK